MFVFVHAQGIKTGVGGGQKMAKFCPCNCWMPSKYLAIPINELDTCPLPENNEENVRVTSELRILFFQ